GGACAAPPGEGARGTGGGAGGPPGSSPGMGAYAPLLERAGLEVTDASLFARPPPLEGEEGIRHWVDMFAGDLLGWVPAGDREAFFRHVEGALRPTLYRQGRWFADYRRLRIVARRADGIEG